MEQFEQLLTCAICLDRYRNPKLLPCQHSFCMEPCMDGLVDYVRRQVKCPECRAEHRIPYQGVQAFPTNVTLQRFLELHIEITGELPDPTSGQTMERCGVCSEKSYCSLCVHCEKKCCPECKDAHMDILRREIARINSQIRRGLHRLQDALALVEKNTLGLQTNCASVAEEVDEIYRRLSKALKDRTEHLRNEIERYSGSEIRGLLQLKENLELEIANIQSNCDLADAHINENVAWDDAELLDTKELFLRTVEFIRNFEYEAGDYGRRVRFVMAHEPNQLVLHVAGYGELNIKPETGSVGHLGTTGGLAPPSGSPGLMRSKSDHRLASQYRQQEEERLARNRYVPDYEYDVPEYETPRNKSRYRSRFMRHRDGEESDGDTRSTVKFSSAPAESAQREKVLDTEDAARGPLSGIFRLTDSPRVMKKLQECERAGKRKKEEPAAPQPPAPKPQIQVRKAPTATAKQPTEDDEISRIKKQNKSASVAQTTETVEERQPVPTTPVHTPPPPREQEREIEESPRRTPIGRRTSEVHNPAARSASSDSSTGSESSTGSGIRSTGAPFTAEEMKQKYLSRAPPTTTTNTVSSGPGITTPTSRDSVTTPTSSPRPFQSRFLGGGNRAAPPPPVAAVREEPAKKKEEEEDDDDEETTSSSEETESETEEESEAETHASTPTTTLPASQERQRNESAMARTDIGPLLARSAEARRGSKEDSPSTRYTSPRGSPAHSVSSPTSTTASSAPGGYTSRFLNKSRSQAAVTTPRERDREREREQREREREIEPEVEPMSPRSRYAALKERRQRLARSRSSHNFGNDDLDLDDDPPSPTTQSPNAYLAAKYGAGSELARSRSTHALKSREPSPDRDRGGTEKDGAALSSWARYLKNKYGNRTVKDKEPPSSTSSIPSSSASAASRRLSLGLPLRHTGQTSFESSDDDQKNPSGSPTSPTAAPVIPAPAGSSTRNQYLLKRRQLFKFGMRGSGAGCFTWPRGLAVGPDNSIVVADSSNHRVQVFDGNGNFMKEFGTYGSGEGQFDCLAGVAVNRIGQFIIADRYNHRIQVLDPSGRFLRTFGSQGTADGRFNYPWGITTDALGFIYVCDKENHRVQVFQSDGTFVGKFGSCGSGRGQLEHPHYIAVSSTNRVIVSDGNNHRVQIFDVNGRVLTSFGSEGSDEGQFKFPRGVAVDDQGYIIVADSGNNRIQIFTPEGTFLKAFGGWGSGDGEFKGLEGVAVTSAGNIVVCDRENHRVQVF
ncbi:RING finger protein nhl-1 isoform X3 [Venturia canescens]|uniref:RING finger protein nhl-1 isoform X3 n=1 Tax=Venturia canescens TaxID=32260 RepID=UPI001C9BD6C4|nr:RING finger protein nhl-1 isoform X3 [Venturia canescens]